jgi:hypothetical protein
VRAVGAGLLQSLPGQIISLSFQVANRTDRDQELLESLQLPADWQAIIPAAVFTLAPQELQVRIIAFSVPASAAAGRYEITYSVRSRSDYGIQDADTAAVIVLPLSKLSILPEEKPDVVIAGDEYHVKLRLVNQGNAPTPLRLAVTADSNYPAQVDVADLVLPAGSNRAVTLTGTTDRNERRMDQRSIQVKALDPKSGEIKAAVAVSFQIVPRVTGGTDLRHTLPVRLSLRATGGHGGMRLQPEVSGSGALDEASTNKVDFLFRGPDAHENGLLGRRDESWLNYFTPNLDLLLGDQSYGLSLLTERYRYGRGIGLDTAAHGLGFGTYYLRSRWEWPPEQQIAAYVKRSFGGDWVKLNVLNRERGGTDTAPPLDAAIWSLEGAAHLTHDIGLSAEYGRSNHDDGARASDDAYRMELEVNRGARRYQFSKLRAGPSYQGYYRDCESTSGTVILPLGSRTQGQVSYERWEQNLDRRPQEATAPRQRLIQANVSRNLKSNWYFSLDYEDFRCEDLLLPTASDHEEHAWGLSVGHTAEAHSLRLELRAGDQHDAAAQSADQLERLSLYANYRPSPRRSFTIYGSLGNSEVQESRLLGFSNNIGVSVNWQPKDDVLFRLGYLRYGFDSDNRKADGVIDSETAYVLRDNSTVTFRVLRHSQALGDQGETSYLLSYTIPFQIPVSRKKSVGAISGAVHYVRNDTRTPIANAIVTVEGAGAATDRNGRFGLGPLAPGRYLLSVDRTSIGPDRVTAEAFPRPVLVTGGETAQIEIPVVDAARVSGRVLVVPADQPSGGVAGAAPRAGALVLPADGLAGPGGSQGVEVGAPQGLENVLVELTSGEEVARRATGADGAFVFEGVRPGKWRLLVYDYNLPAFHYLETPALDLDLTAGESKDVLVRVLPRVRHIKMIEDGNADLAVERR